MPAKHRCHEDVSHRRGPWKSTKEIKEAIKVASSSPLPHPALAMAPPHKELRWGPAAAAAADHWNPYSISFKTLSRCMYFVLKERRSSQQNPTAEFLFSARVLLGFKLSPPVWVSLVAAMIHLWRMSNVRAASWHQASPSPEKLFQLLQMTWISCPLFLENSSNDC